jgi:hypothetical protein
VLLAHARRAEDGHGRAVDALDELEADPELVGDAADVTGERTPMIDNSMLEDPPVVHDR